MDSNVFESSYRQNVYANLLVILYRQQQYVRADELRREAALLFPFDRRFDRRGF